MLHLKDPYGSDPVATGTLVQCLKTVADLPESCMHAKVTRGFWGGKVEIKETAVDLVCARVLVVSGPPDSFTRHSFTKQTVSFAIPDALGGGKPRNDHIFFLRKGSGNGL